jgi:regulator of sigma E protease
VIISSTNSDISWWRAPAASGSRPFSIGFGGEIFGWTDKKGTRWKVCWLPLGGYVMFEGDANAASIPDPEAVAKMTDGAEEAGVAAEAAYGSGHAGGGGGAAGQFRARLRRVHAAVRRFPARRTLGTYIGAVQDKSPAAEAGMKPGDKITAVDGKAVKLFNPDLIDAIQGSKQRTHGLTIQRGTARFWICRSRRAS